MLPCVEHVAADLDEAFREQKDVQASQASSVIPVLEAQFTSAEQRQQVGTLNGGCPPVRSLWSHLELRMKGKAEALLGLDADLFESRAPKRAQRAKPHSDWRRAASITGAMARGTRFAG